MLLTLAYHIDLGSFLLQLSSITAYVGGIIGSGLWISVCLYNGKSGCLVFDLYSSCAFVI
jgi:hypothetical protein